MSKLSDFVDGGGVLIPEKKPLSSVYTSSGVFTAPEDGFVLVDLIGGGGGGSLYFRNSGTTTTSNGSAGGSSRVSFNGVSFSALGGGGGTVSVEPNTAGVSVPSGYSYTTFKDSNQVIDGRAVVAHSNSSFSIMEGKHGGGGGRHYYVNLSGEFEITSGGFLGGSGGIGGGYGGGGIKNLFLNVKKGDSLTITIGAGGGGATSPRTSGAGGAGGDGYCSVNFYPSK